MPIADKYKVGGSHHAAYAAARRKWKENNEMGTFEKKIRRLLALAKSRAKNKGIDYCITAEDFTATAHCPLLGDPIDFNKRGRGSARNSPTIDRIDPTKGYVPGNVWVISARANLIKSDATLEELEMLVENLRKHTRR